MENKIFYTFHQKLQDEISDVDVAYNLFIQEMKKYRAAHKGIRGIKKTYPEKQMEKKDLKKRSTEKEELNKVSEERNLTSFEKELLFRIDSLENQIEHLQKITETIIMHEKHEIVKKFTKEEWDILNM